MTPDTETHMTTFKPERQHFQMMDAVATWKMTPERLDEQLSDYGRDVLKELRKHSYVHTLPDPKVVALTTKGKDALLKAVGLKSRHR